MSQLTFVFRSAPHQSTSGREGIDAVLAASAYCEDITVIFSGDGVFQLLRTQDTRQSLIKDYAPMFKLLELYDVENIYVCTKSLQDRGVEQAPLILDAEPIGLDEISSYLSTSKKILTF